MNFPHAFYYYRISTKLDLKLGLVVLIKYIKINKEIKRSLFL